MGNITAIEKHRAGLEAESGLYEYAYDPVGRLISAQKDGRSREYQYDSLGNRMAELCGGRETRHEYNARNQLIRTLAGEDVTDYRYDKRGNLTQVAENGRVKGSYVFDATNRMVSDLTERGSAQYAYNGFLKRVSRLEKAKGEALPDPARELRYVLDLTRPCNDLLATEGAWEQSYIWGNELLSAKGEHPFAYLTDHLGSPIRLMGEEGEEQALSYDEFGVPKVEAASSRLHNPFGFTGYQADDTTGLCYTQARYYSPNNARFVSVNPHWHPENMIYGDTKHTLSGSLPVPDSIAINQSGNLYMYCINNPLTYYDADGRLTMSKGFSGSITVQGYGGVDAHLVADDKGNVGFMFTRKYGGGVVAGVSAGRGFSTTNAETIFDLRNLGGGVGAGGGELIVAGMDFVMGEGFMGASGFVGAGYAYQFVQGYASNTAIIDLNFLPESIKYLITTYVRFPAFNLPDLAPLALLSYLIDLITGNQDMVLCD